MSQSFFRDEEGDMENGKSMIHSPCRVESPWSRGEEEEVKEEKERWVNWRKKESESIWRKRSGCVRISTKIDLATVAWVTGPSENRHVLTASRLFGRWPRFLRRMSGDGLCRRKRGKASKCRTAEVRQTVWATVRGRGNANAGTESWRCWWWWRFTATGRWPCRLCVFLIGYIGRWSVCSFVRMNEHAQPGDDDADEDEQRKVSVWPSTGWSGTRTRRRKEKIKKT